jgi:hypothetical protein
MLAVVIGLTFVLDAIPTGLYGNDNSDSIGAVEGWLIAYLLGSHLAFALSARRAVPT